MQHLHVMRLVCARQGRLRALLLPRIVRVELSTLGNHVPPHYLQSPGMGLLSCSYAWQLRMAFTSTWSPPASQTVPCATAFASLNGSSDQPFPGQGPPLPPQLAGSPPAKATTLTGVPRPSPPAHCQGPPCTCQGPMLTADHGKSRLPWKGRPSKTRT